jgi:NADH-quinone oxidoreductase subunit F
MAQIHLDRHYLLRHRDRPDVRSLAGYRADGGYEAWLGTLERRDPAAVAAAVAESGLRGRGGAGFPTGRKWGFLPQDGRPRVLVVNADEGEPGTFKDRELLELNPHLVLEGILLAAYAIGAAESFIYIRGEFLRGYEVMAEALQEAVAAGLVGRNIAGSGYDHRIHLYRGAGAYICGEETALLESLEGHRGQPRVKPPFPAVHGLYGLPTVVNNPETLANVPYIVKYGPQWYRQWGSPESPGIKIFSVSGSVASPGNYEVPLGISLNELLDMAGGPKPGTRVKAVIPGGSSMPVLPASRLDVRLTYEDLAKAGSQLGSGGVIVLDDSVCMVAAAERVVRFYRDESCGKCTPCREGTYWNRDVLARLEQGLGTESDLDLLLDVSDNINECSLCPLGPASTGFLVSVLQYFRDEFVEHVRGKACPYGGGGFGWRAPLAGQPA